MYMVNTTPHVYAMLVQHLCSCSDLEGHNHPRIVMDDRAVQALHYLLCWSASALKQTHSRYQLPMSPIAQYQHYVSIRSCTQQLEPGCLRLQCGLPWTEGVWWVLTGLPMGVPSTSHTWHACPTWWSWLPAMRLSCATWLPLQLPLMTGLLASGPAHETQSLPMHGFVCCCFVESISLGKGWGKQGIAWLIATIGGLITHSAAHEMQSIPMHGFVVALWVNQSWCVRNMG